MPSSSRVFVTLFALAIAGLVEFHATAEMPVELQSETQADFVEEPSYTSQWPETSIANVESACDSYGTCSVSCDSPGFWATAEYLYWQTRGMNLPPLVTSSASGTLQGDAGVLDLASTSILLGNDQILNSGQSGGRFQFGFWLDDYRDYGIDLVYTMIGDQDDSFSASSNQFPTLARPFFNVSPGEQDSRLIGFPAVVSGDVSIDATMQYQVFEALIRRPVSHDLRNPTYVLYGYRYGELKDSVSIRDSSTSLAGATSGATVRTTDAFGSTNRFNGFEMGLNFEPRLAVNWDLSLTGKVAFGETSTETAISGQTVSTSNTAQSTTTSGGLLAQNSNIGIFQSTSHGVLQDFSISLRRYFQPGLTLNIGYGIHRWSDVERAGEQIDTSLNPTQIPPGTLVGDARPGVRQAKSDFVAQGLTLGLEVDW